MQHYDMNSITLGEQIKKIRKSKKWTQSDLGDKVGMTHQEISRIENGLNNIGIDTLSEVADALGYEIKLVERGD